MNVNDYHHDALNEEFSVWSETLNRSFYGTSLSQARANRDAAEAVYYRHHRHDLLPVEH